MQNGIPALEDTIKFEVVEVKIETAEAESGLLGIEQTSWRPPIKVEQTDELVLNRYNFVCCKTEQIEECEELKIEVEEVIIKEEHDESNEEKAVNR
nr:unnamed protein product [Callosobruchus chinensis]